MMTREEVEKKAHQILVEHGMVSIPVDPVIIANHLGIRVSNAVFSDTSLSGMIARRGDKKSLLVNVNDTIERKRFTIAHELGHCILHLDDEGEFVDSTSDLFRSTENGLRDEDYYQEVEANRFAAALLMDADLVRKAWSTCADIDKMARMFRVSESAMINRLKSMGLV